MREHEWINAPEARKRRSKRSLYAITDILNAIDHGHAPPLHAMAVMAEVSLESARAGAWRMLSRRDPSGDALDELAPAGPVAEPRQCDWDDDPRATARYDDRYWDAKYDNDGPGEDS